MLHDEMIDTHNSVAIVTQEEYTISDSKYNKREYVDKSSNLIDGLDDLSSNLLL